MKILKDAGKTLLNKDKDKKSGKGKDFMNGLKTWITSPGGIITLVLIIGTLWYVHSRTAKGAKA